MGRGGQGGENSHLEEEVGDTNYSDSRLEVAAQTGEKAAADACGEWRDDGR